MSDKHWQSKLLGELPWVTHATSTRAWGSLRYPGSDEDEDKTLSDREEFIRSAGIDPTTSIYLDNVHGAKVACVGTNLASNRMNGCDAAFCIIKGRHLVTKTADCLPIFIVDRRLYYVGLVHAGWQGVSHGIVKNLIEALKQERSYPHDLLVAIGPSIGACHYTVDHERKQEMLQRSGGLSSSDFTGQKDNRHTVDLREVVVRQFMAQGVPQKQIENAAPCTACDNDNYFSYHLTQEPDCMLSVIGIK